MGNRTDDNRGISDLPFTVSDRDLPGVIQYQGQWILTAEGDVPKNFWAVTMDGKGIPFNGHPSPQQILDEANGEGFNCAYVAPYGCHVIGRDDGIQLHDWIKDNRHKHRHGHH